MTMKVLAISLLGWPPFPVKASLGPTVDSRERFYGAIFAACDVAWVWAEKHTPPADRLMRFPAVVFLPGGLRRVRSLRPARTASLVPTRLGAIELVLPAIPPPGTEKETRY